jgi:hypothetical protein
MLNVRVGYNRREAYLGEKYSNVKHKIRGAIGPTNSYK